MMEPGEVLARAATSILNVVLVEPGSGLTLDFVPRPEASSLHDVTSDALRTCSTVLTEVSLGTVSMERVVVTGMMMEVEEGAKTVLD